MTKTRTVSNLEEISALEKKVRAAIRKTVSALGGLIDNSKPFNLFYAMKFEPVGYDPLEPERPLNLIEQINQSFSYLVTLRGAAYLLRKHPTAVPFMLNFGTAPGPDIVSADRSVMAEAFAATRTDSNRKLRKDIEKMRARAAGHKYVFFYTHEAPPKAKDEGEVETVFVDISRSAARPAKKRKPRAR